MKDFPGFILALICDVLLLVIGLIVIPSGVVAAGIIARGAYALFMIGWGP